MTDAPSLTEIASLPTEERLAWLEDAACFLLVERHGVSDEQATVELTSEALSPPTRPSPRARVFRLLFGATGVLRLGRSPACDIVLDDPAVSSAHLQLLAHGSRVLVSDDGSQNGSELNGTRLTPAKPAALAPGDVLTVAARYRATFLDQAGLLALIGTTQVLSGKVAVITGAGRGLGRAYALRFAAEGCFVVVNDLGAPPYGEGSDASVVAEVVAEIEAAGGRAVASSHDISRADQVDALFDLAKREAGGVDILVCSAGALHAGPSVLELTLEAWDTLMNVNARGTFLCVQAAARAMVAGQRRGRIITTSSMAAMNGNAGLSGYAASKAAIYGLTLCASLELWPHGITVNALTPMAFTRLTRDIPAIAEIPEVEQVLSPSFVADVALFLASDAAASITGQVVDVGGPQLSFYRMRRTEPGTPEGARWSAQELLRRWTELSEA